jgi:hypothetical protein
LRKGIETFNPDASLAQIVDVAFLAADFAVTNLDLRHHVDLAEEGPILPDIEVHCETRWILVLEKAFRIDVERHFPWTPTVRIMRTIVNISTRLPVPFSLVRF